MITYEDRRFTLKLALLTYHMLAGSSVLGDTLDGDLKDTDMAVK